MTATDDLRSLLDERGVEHVDAEDGHTQHTWWSDGDHEIAACNSGERLAVYDLTPEQAVEATLGGGTCRFKWSLARNGWADHTCSECGYRENTDIHVSLGWHYCPNCGRRIEVDA